MQIRRGPGLGSTVSAVALVGAPYRYRLHLVPHDFVERDGTEVDADSGARPVPGWELVSSRVTSDGDELSVFRRPVSSERVS